MIVNVKDQAVDVGPLSWPAYKSLKTLVLQQCGTEVMQAIGDMRPGGSLSDGLDKMTRIVGAVLSSVDEQFLAGCIRGVPPVFDELTMDEMGELLQAATAANPIDKILAFEKNSPAGTLVAQLVSKLSSVPGASQVLKAAGGSALNLSSPTDTGGPLAT